MAVQTVPPPPRTGTKPLRVIYSSAPVRICDNGGWTDTWFAKHGKIFNIAANPSITIELKIFPNGDLADRFSIYSESFGEWYVPGKSNDPGKRYRLVEAILGSASIDNDLSLEAVIRSGVPAGSATGTSASVAVALLGAIGKLQNQTTDPYALARKAHEIETKVLGLQSGIQDQICAAFGGINFIDMKEYPNADVYPLTLPEDFYKELEERLVLVYLGSAHQSSGIHEKVIQQLESSGPECVPLQLMRDAAEHSRDAVVDGNFIKLGEAMKDNTKAQSLLHPDLISPDAFKIIECARQQGAIGWKVNGAGGSGGSMTLLASNGGNGKRGLIQRIQLLDSKFSIISVTINRQGLTVDEKN